jgi:hypothetical protein
MRAPAGAWLIQLDESVPDERDADLEALYALHDIEGVERNRGRKSQVVAIAREVSHDLSKFFWPDLVIPAVSIYVKCITH